MINRLNLYDENFNRIDLESLGLFGLNLVIPSPSYSSTVEELDGGGRVVLDKKLNSRSLTATFMTVANTYEDSLSQKSLLYGLLGNGKEFYIEQINKSGIVWKCLLDEWNPEMIGSSITLFEVPMTCLNGYSESISISKKSFRNTNTFTFKNEGNLVVDPRVHGEFTIEFWGASTDLTISNKTTGDSWKHYGTTELWEIITLQGVKQTKNYGTNILKNTNKKVITLAEGNNTFEIVGSDTTDSLIKISTRFYFL